MPLPKGPRNAHIQETYGADTNLMKFYITSNSTAYGSHWDKFKPRTGKHTGTGYQSNFRPGVYYHKRLDDVDNPAMGNIVARNYHSVQTRDFRPHSHPTGKEALPFAAINNGIGFVREQPVTIPTEQQVKDAHANTRLGGNANDFGPKQKPYLHKIQRKDPVELENEGHGPGAMTSEFQVRYQGQQPDRSDTNYKSLGPKQVQGHVHNDNVEPITFVPGDPHKGEKPRWMTGRPTGLSQYTYDYMPLRGPNGKERLPGIVGRSDHDSGFTKEKPKPAFAERGPGQFESTTGTTFLGQQRPTASEAQRLDRQGVGLKDDTGFTSNADVYTWHPDEPRRFVTHYNTRFYDKTQEGQDREGHTWGGLQPTLPDGYTKSTAVHSLGPDVDATATMRHLEPYVARSLRARDKFYDDHTYDSKIHRTATVAA